MSEPQSIELKVEGSFGVEAQEDGNFEFLVCMPWASESCVLVNRAEARRLADWLNDRLAEDVVVHGG